MDKREACEIIEKQLWKEIILVAESMQKANAMSNQDMDRLDKLYHTLKDKGTVEAMYEAKEYEDGGMSGTNQNGNGMSGYRGRAMNGRFVSRDSSYSDGYRQGYSEAMNQMQGPYYNGEPRRW